MSAVGRLAPSERPSGLAPPDRHVIRTFLGGLYWAGRVVAGVRLYRYGATPDQVGHSAQPWVYLTEDRYAFSEDAIRFCSLLDATVADHGERDPDTGEPSPPVARLEAWNTAAYVGEFRATRDLYVWAGRAAPLAFDRVRGGVLESDGGSRGLSTTPGGASQVVVPRSALASGALRLARPPLPLARVRHLH